MISLKEISETIDTKGRFWIAFTGDSITSCEWVHPNWREIVEYVLKEELQKMYGENWRLPSWGLRGFNFAYDGATTKDVLEKVGDIAQVQPNLVISVMGSNDCTKLNIEDHVNNIKSFSEQVGTKVVWCTSSSFVSEERNQEYAPFAKASMQISENENLQLIDLFSSYKEFPIERFFTFKENGGIDDTHPNQLGNAYIAKVILKEVFGISFDPELYWRDTRAGEKYPKY